MSDLKFSWLIFAVCILLNAGSTLAAELRVAVASNFSAAMTDISARFEKQSGHQVTLIFGSTGKHYAQVKHGAPYDVFFAADAKRPKLLEHEGVAKQGSRFTYALGKIILWSPEISFVDAKGEVLEQGDFRYLAIANPKFAPYGQAAVEVLQARGLWDTLSPRIVRGENIGQAFQFIKSGNAKLGFVAYSQLKRPGQTVDGSRWEVPQSLYAPIKQQAVLINDSQAAQNLLSFVQTEEILEVIRDHGYDTP